MSHQLQIFTHFMLALMSIYIDFELTDKSGNWRYFLVDNEIIIVILTLLIILRKRRYKKKEDL